MTKLCSSWHRALRALDAAPNKELPFGQLRSKANVTQRGFSLMFGRMEDANLIARVEGKLAVATITFGGIRALRAEDAR